jgi:HEAT repeat protein
LITTLSGNRKRELLLSRGKLDSEDIQEILFVLARDNEAENILDMLTERPDIAEQIAFQGVNYEDRDARWQIAVLLGRLGTGKALDHLRSMRRDPDEYVRRRALLELRDHDAELSERIAIEWLDSEYDYSRMVALDTLAFLNSPALEMAMEKLDEDPSEVVQKRIRIIAASSTNQ